MNKMNGFYQSQLVGWKHLYLLFEDGAYNDKYAHVVYNRLPGETYPNYDNFPHHFSSWDELRISYPRAQLRCRISDPANNSLPAIKDAFEKGVYFPGPQEVIRLAKIPLKARAAILQHFCFFCANLYPCKCKRET
jgi:hypothetical protein